MTELRRQFERWMLGHTPVCHAELRHTQAGYFYEDVQRNWEVWQAAYALAKEVHSDEVA